MAERDIMQLPTSELTRKEIGIIKNFVRDAINAGNMTRVCIAVIDESDSQTTAIMESQWTQFRSQFPYRKFYLLTPSATNAFGTPSESNDFDRLRCPDNFLTETTINTPPLI